MDMKKTQTTARQSLQDSAKRVALYCRVSTDGQTVENQLIELQAVAARHGWLIVETYTDHGISGAKGRAARPGFDALCKAVARKECELVAVWSVDRLGRSLPDLVTFLSDLHAKGVDLYLHQQGLDTSTPTGRAMYQMMGVFAEFERSMIQERVKAGLARARSQGKTLGRPKVSPEVEEQILHARREGKGIIKIAKEVGCGVGTVQRIIQSHN
jgi:DNA invertase Pin-like site-specific DNA recombinase